ncbi:MAG: hypothetical protein IBJ11_08800 [Phycisphaerales bacterium]|nr:hypothetical protein [Phycisphaerales bacterium]
MPTRPIQKCRTALSLLALAATAALTGCSAGGSWGLAHFTEMRTVEAPHQPGSGIDVATSNGKVSVERAAVSAVSIRATIRAESAERAERVKIVAERAGGSGASGGAPLTVRAEWPDGRRPSEGVAFSIDVPDAAGVSVSTSNGSIDVKGLSGRATLSTSNGAVNVWSHRGPVEAASSNGAIAIEQVPGPVKALTSNGRVAVRLDDDGPGPVEVVTSNGRIELTVGPGFAGDVDAGTSNGTIALTPSAPGRKATLGTSARVPVGGAGGPTSILRTSNASVEVVVRARRLGG